MREQKFNESVNEQLMETVKEKLNKMVEDNYDQLDIYKGLKEAPEKKKEILCNIRARCFKNAVFLTTAAGVLTTAGLVAAWGAVSAIASVVAIGKRL